MDKIRSWLGRLSPPPPKQQSGWPRENTAERGARADHLTGLQATVSTLQQELLSLSEVPADGSDPAGQIARSHRIDEIEREMEKAQRELGKYQGRI